MTDFKHKYIKAKSDMSFDERIERLEKVVEQKGKNEVVLNFDAINKKIVIKGKKGQTFREGVEFALYMIKGEI